LFEIGYVHEVIRKRAEVGQNLLPRVNRVVALLKRWLLGTYQGAVRPSHLDYYLDEFAFRFNRMRSRSRGGTVGFSTNVHSEHQTGGEPKLFFIVIYRKVPFDSSFLV